MRKIIERIVKSEGIPTREELWLDPQTNELKHFENDRWKKITDSSANPPTMLVHGTFNDSKFVPDVGQPTFAEALIHYNAGGEIRLKIIFRFDEGDAPFIMPIIGYYKTSEGSERLLYALPEDFSIPLSPLQYSWWENPDSNNA